jgi:hypothetical protein
MNTLTPQQIIAFADQGAIIEVLDNVFLASSETWRAVPNEWDPSGAPVEAAFEGSGYWIKTVPEQAKETVFLAKRIAVSHRHRGMQLGVKMFGSGPGEVFACPTITCPST